MAKRIKRGPATKAAPNGTANGLPIVGTIPVTGKRLKNGSSAVFVMPPELPKKKRRRRRRRTSQLLSARLITDVNKKKRDFLRQVSQMLTDALGFDVRVSLVAPKMEMTPAMRKASRMTKAEVRQYTAEYMSAPLHAPVSKDQDRALKKLNDEVPF